jgi:hypothetical protein
MLVLEVSPGDVDTARLSVCQREAAAGKYALALAGFLRWLAPQYGDLRQGLKDEVAALREQFQADEQHARTPTLVADLALGLRYLLRYARCTGAVAEEEESELWGRGLAALAEAAAAQQQHQADAEPATQFLRLIAAALSSGRCHTDGTDGHVPPERAGACGWRDGQPQGRCIGWVDGDNLYLDPEAAFAEAQALARDQGTAISVTARTLWRRLAEKGLLASRDLKRQRNTVQRTIQGVRDRAVLHLRSLMEPEPSVPSVPSVDPDKPLENRGSATDGREKTGRKPSVRPSVQAGHTDGRTDGHTDGYGPFSAQPSVSKPRKPAGKRQVPAETDATDGPVTPGRDGQAPRIVEVRL